MVDAIETKAYGYRFRSRLEARWAVFLSSLGLDWEYEREGYVIDGRPYLPDFWLPCLDPSCRAAGWGLWLEIKPTWPLTREQEALYAGLALHTGHRVLAACGPGPWSCRTYIFDHHHAGDPLSIPLCDSASFAQDRNSGEVILFSPRPRRTEPIAYCSRGDLIRAFEAAKSARFEHGESP
jgi:hypothetical protein